LQTEQWKKERANDVDDMIVQVEEAFREFDPRTIEKGYVTLQSSLEEIILLNGDNTYTTPHLGKDAYLREHGKLHWQLKASDRVLEDLIANDVMDLETLLQQWEEEEEGGPLVAV
jgi:hypothetical protein